MTLEMELKRRDGISRQEGNKAGHEEERREIILNIASMQTPVEVIAQATRSIPEFVKSVLSQNT